MPLYDTSIFVGHVRGNVRTRSLIKMLQEGTWSVFVSSITIYELHFGCLLSNDPVRDQGRVARYVSHVSGILPVDSLVARRAAEIQVELRRDNRMLDHRDLFVAATALVHGLSVCTLDVDHFGRVTGVVLEKF